MSTMPQFERKNALQNSPKWKIDNLEIANFRHIDCQSLSFSPEVTLLIGENGTGKTAILDAAGVMLSTIISEFGGDPAHFSHQDARLVDSDLNSMRKTATSEPQYPVSAEISMTVDSSRLHWRREIGSERGRTTRGDLETRKYFRHLRERATSESVGEDRNNSNRTYSEITLPVIAHYGVERLAGTRRASGSIPRSRTGAYSSALDPRSDLTRLAKFIEVLNNQITDAFAYGDPQPLAATNQMNAIRLACDSILKHSGWKGLRWNRHLESLTLHHGDFGTQPLSNLSSGTRIAAGLALDLASRMARANPHLGSEQLLTQTPGIVLIDEIDLHLHPSWQKVIVPSLLETFPRVQFILTTHSPQVIATVKSENIRILGRESIFTPEVGFGLKPEKILQYLQGTNPEPEVEERELIDRYLALVFEGGMESAREAAVLRNRIEDILGGAEYNPELLRADAHLAFKSILSEEDEV